MNTYKRELSYILLLLPRMISMVKFNWHIGYSPLFFNTLSLFILQEISYIFCQYPPLLYVLKCGRACFPYLNIGSYLSYFVLPITSILTVPIQFNPVHFPSLLCSNLGTTGPYGDKVMCCVQYKCLL